MLVKTLDASITDVDITKGVTQGYLSNWDNLDHDGDFTVRGKSFVKTVSESGPAGKGTIQYLLNHKWEQPAGVFTSITEDNIGLPYVAQLTKNRHGVFTPRSEELIALYDTGYKFNHSYGYKVARQQKTAQGNMLQEVILFEGSILTMPGANPLTPLTEMKCETIQDWYDRYAELSLLIDKAQKRGNWQDETYEQLALRKQVLDDHRQVLETALASRRSAAPEASTQPKTPDTKSEDWLAAFRKGLYATSN